MKFGLDRLLEEPGLQRPLQGQRIALLAHPASVTRNLTHALDALAGLDGIELTAAFGPDFSYETLDQHWGRHYHARLAEGPVPVKAGARELLRFLAASGIPRALVTSTRRVTAVDKLQRTQLLAFFGFLVCGGETDLGKPHPDPYLAAADGLGIAPEH